MTSLSRSILFAAIAASFYGIVAYFANNTHGHATAMTAAFTQAAASGLVTFLSVGLMESLFNIPNKAVSKYLLSSAGSGLIILGIFVLFHLVTGTPNLIKTLLPIIVLGTPYISLYPLTLLKKDKKKKFNNSLT